MGAPPKRLRLLGLGGLLLLGAGGVAALPDVVLPAHTPAISTLAAVDRLPVCEHNDRLNQGILQLDLTSPIGAKGQTLVGTRAIEAWSGRERDVEEVDVEANAKPRVGVVA